MALSFYEVIMIVRANNSWNTLQSRAKNSELQHRHMVALRMNLFVHLFHTL